MSSQMQNTPETFIQNAPLVVGVRNFVEAAKGNKFGRIDVDLANGITIVGVTLHKQGDKIWIGLPAQEYLTKDYDKRFVNIFKFSDGVKEQFQHEILVALNLTESRLV